MRELFEGRGRAARPIYEPSLRIKGEEGDLVLYSTPRTFDSMEEAAAAYDRIMMFHENLSGLSPQSKRK